MKDMVLGQRYLSAVAWQLGFGQDIQILNIHDASAFARAGDGALYQYAIPAPRPPRLAFLNVLQQENRLKRWLHDFFLSSLCLRWEQHTIRQRYAMPFHSYHEVWRLIAGIKHPQLGTRWLQTSHLSHKSCFSYFVEEMGLFAMLPGSIQKSSQLPQNIFVRAEVFMKELSDVWERVEKALSKQGHWVRSSLNGQTNSAPCPNKISNSDLPNLVPPRYQFVPNDRKKSHHADWHLLAYDSHRQHILCWNGQYYQSEFKLFELKQPLYRFCKRLTFMNRHRNLYLKEQDLWMPDMVINTEAT